MTHQFLGKILVLFFISTHLLLHQVNILPKSYSTVNEAQSSHIKLLKKISLKWFFKQCPMVDKVQKTILKYNFNIYFHVISKFK